MGSHSPVPLATPQIPVIDFADKTLKPGSSKWEEVKLDVRKALEDYGCFEASFDKLELKKSILEATEELFGLPIQTKQRNVVSSNPFLRYNSVGDRYECLVIDESNVLDKVYDFTQQLWPHHGNKSISETIYGFSEQSRELDVMVRRMIMESFGVEKYLDEHLNSTNYTFRVMKYSSSPDADTEETNIGLNPHTDKNIMTVVHQCQVDGLEVMTKDEKWIKVKPSQDSFVVMAGDSLSALMNGRVMSPDHRVMMKGKKTRYSTALFSYPKPGVIIDTLEELVDEEHPRVYKPYVYDELIDFFTKEPGRSAKSTIRAFAAI